MKNFKFAACLILIQLSFTVHAELDSHDQDALKQTQDLLKNRNERSKAIKDDKAAEEADLKADALVGGGQNKEELYGIASKAMEKMVKEADGDPIKLQQLLQQVQSNPKAFYQKLDVAEKNKIREMADKIEKKKPELDQTK